MTDQDGKVIMDQDYLPFGGDLPGVGQVEVQNDSGEGYKYTGQKDVMSIGLYYYGARYYDPEIGRFITEDSYFGQLALPPSQNLYVYVMNNSMMFVDPSGNSAEEYDFDMDLDLSPFEYDFSLTDFKFEIPDPWEMIYEGVSFREFDDFVALKVEHEAIANNTIVIENHIGRRMTVANTISNLSNKDDIIYGGTGTYFYGKISALGYMITGGQDMTPKNLSEVGPKYYNITEHRSFIGYNDEGFITGRGKDIFSSNLIWGLGGLTSIMEDGKFTSYFDTKKKEGQNFTPDQLYSTWHMMFGINRNNNQELSFREYDIHKKRSGKIKIKVHF